VGGILRALLLCGGRSSRFGSDKLLADWNGGTLVAASAASLLEGAGNALAVIPPGSALLRRALEGAGCDVLESPDTRRGLGASLAAGVAHAPDAGGWIVALGDMPRVSPSTIARVCRALGEGAAIAAPVVAGGERRGHPVGFARALKGELLALDGDEGARSVIERHADKVVLIPVDDPGITFDVDRPSDLEGPI